MASSSFDPPADVEPWVSLSASEDAFETLLERLRGGATCLAVVACDGTRRATSLEALGERLRPAFRPAYIPFPALPAGEIASWALGLLGVSPQGDPEARLAQVARRGPGPVVLLLDEAEALPVATARRLCRLVASAAGHLRLVAACAAETRTRRVLGALGGPLTLRLIEERDSDGSSSHAQASGPGPDAAEQALRRQGPPQPAETRRSPDPLTLTPDPARDRLRPALERLAGALAGDLRAGAPITAVTGAPGSGKTLVLRLLARRLAQDVPTAWLPYPALPPEDACTWIASLLGAPAGPGGEERLRTVLSGADAERERRAIVFVDEAAALPEATRRRLAALARELPGLQLVLGWSDAAALDAGRVLGSQVPLHPVRELLTLPEVEAMLRARLGPDELAVLTPSRVQALFEESRGNPAALLRAADGWRRQMSPAREASGPMRCATGSTQAAQKAPDAIAPAALLWPPERAQTDRRSRRRVLAVACLLASAAIFTPALLGRDAAPGRGDGGAAPPALARAGEDAFVPVSPATPKTPAPAAASDSAPATPDPPPVLVHINATPWARILIDGREIGLTPLGNVPLEPGPHALRAYMADGTTVERTIEVDPARPYFVIQPDPSP